MKLRIHTYLNLCTLYVLLWGLYGFHWYDSAKGTEIDAWSNVFLGINMLISFWVVLKFFKRKVSSFFHGVNVLLLIFIIYGLFYIVGGETHYMNGHPVNKASYLLGILRSYLPLYTFYFFANKRILNRENLTFYFLLLFAFSILYNVYYSRYWISAGYDDGFTNNLGYVFVSFFPFVFIYKHRPMLQYVILAIITGLAIMSMKRGAIIISLLLLMWFLYSSMSHVKSSRRYFILILTFAILSLSYMYIGYLYDSSSYFQARMDQTMEGGSSGRDVLYLSLLDHFWNHSSAVQQLFGSGPNATLDILGKEAHNDWLEILICQGLFGLIVYAFFWYNCFLCWKRVSKISVCYSIVGAFVITQFLRTLFSMSYSTIPTAATLILGYALAVNEINKKQN